MCSLRMCGCESDARMTNDKRRLPSESRRTTSERGAERAAPPRFGRRRGMILFIVVIVIAMLSLSGFSFVSLLSTENRAVHIRGDELQLEQVLGSGIAMVKGFVAMSPELRRETGGGFDNVDMFHAVLVVDDPVRGRRARFSVVSPRIEDETIRGIRFGVENESARLNLASVLEWESRQPGAGRNALMQLPGMTESLADAILDWIDPDSTPRQSGAENEYYADQNVPYGPRNAIPTSIEELLLVRGVTRDLLYGSDLNEDYQVDADEVPTGADRASGVGTGVALPWAALLTVHSAERNLTPEGQPRINLNDPDLVYLDALLSRVFDRPTAEFVVAYRQFGPDLARPGSASGTPAPINPTALPPRFAFSSVLDLIDAQVRVPSVARGLSTPLASPYTSNLIAMRRYLPQLLEYVTTVASPVIRGRINVNLAPRAVLAGVPGLDDALITKILASRDPQEDQQDASHRYPTWLLTDGIVTLPVMRDLLPYLTAGGDVYRAQVAAFFDAPGPSARAEVVIDATGSVPREVYWKDMRALGLGHSRELIGNTSVSP